MPNGIVFLYVDGLMSSHIHGLKVGDTLAVKGKPPWSSCSNSMVPNSSFVYSLPHVF